MIAMAARVMGRSAVSPRWPRWWVWLLVVLPPWWSSPGRIAADTKIYLSVDPGALLNQAPSLWDADVGLGTVTHQTIGYLFPQGPWWWIADQVGSPDWVTQRLWWIAVVAVAIVGAHRLAATVGLGAHGIVTAACAYGLSPYLFQYISRISAILLPWAVLPWMILALRRAVMRGGWRDPARFALAVLIAGTVNATAIIFAVAGAVVWVVAEWGVRACWAPVMRAALCSAAVSSWWMTALVVQGRHGIDILRFTETYATISSTALPTELMRGAGYWFSYGGDWLDPWVGATAGILTQPWYVAVGLTTAALAVAGVRFIPDDHRRPVGITIIAGLAMAMGSASVGAWTPWGLFFEQLVSSEVGMSLRSTPRAAPVALIGLAIGCGALADRWAADSRQIRFAAPIGWIPVVATLVMAAPWFTGGIVTEAITHRELPSHVVTASAVADEMATADGTRVWITPGSDFASQRWGGTIDPVTPGLTDRATVARELIPLGTDGAADVVSEVERRVAENTLAAAAVAPVARLMGVDTVIARNDIEFERYATARPDDVTERLDAADLTRVWTGPVVAHDRALVDEQSFGGVPGIGDQPQRAVWAVDGTPAVVSVRSGATAALQGSAATLVTLAEHGLIDGTEVLVEVDSDAGVGVDVDWSIIGDSNRYEDRRWYSVGSTLGATRAADWEGDDPSLQSLTTAAPSRRTVARLDGPVVEVTASSYGSPAILSAEDRPVHALDGDLFTAWRAAALEGTAGTYIDLALHDAVRPGGVTLVQPLMGERDRYITQVRVSVAADAVDGGRWREVEAALSDESRTATGQRVSLDGEPIERLRIEVLADNVGPLPGYGNSPGVGFAEIIIDGVEPTQEWIVLPDDVVDAPRTTVVFDRRRLDASIPNRFDPEPQLRREFTVSTADSFRMTGAVADAAHDPRPHPVLIESSPDLIGVGDVLWVSDFDPVDPYVVVSSDPEGGDLLRIVTMTGPIVSPVAQVVITDSAGSEHTVVVDADGVATIERGALAAGPLHLGFVVETPALTRDPFSDRSRTLPVGIVSVTPVEISGERDRPVGCVDDLVAIDGLAVSVRLDGDVLVGCAPVKLSAGTHQLSTVAGHLSGIDINRIVLDTGAGPVSTVVRDVDMSRTDTVVSADLETLEEPGWLVFAESFSSGWTARLDGEDLGPAVAVNGYAMAWQLDAGRGGRLDITWEPQRWVNRGLLVGAFATLVVAAVALRCRGRDTARDPRPPLAHGTLMPLMVIGLAAGPLGLAAPLLAPAVRRGRWRTALVLGMPLMAAWAWVAQRELRWDPPLDLRWPGAFGWVQPWVIVVVVTVVWTVCWPDATPADELREHASDDDH